MRTLTPEDMEIIRTSMAEAVAKGLSDIGLGFDDETEKKAIRSDLGWVRQQRELADARTKQVRSGVWTALIFVCSVAAVFLLSKIGAFSAFLTNVFTSNAGR